MSLSSARNQPLEKHPATSPAKADGDDASSTLSRTYQIDHARLQAAVREILLAVGEDPDREGLRETPARVGRMYAELFAGLER